MGSWIFSACIPGDPIGKGRARGTVRGGHVRMYTPKKTSDWVIVQSGCFESMTLII